MRTGGTSLQLNGGSFPGRYCPAPPPAKKIVVKSQTPGKSSILTGYELTTNGIITSLLTGPDGDQLGPHSLSWESDENKRPGVVQHGNVLIAKVWTPEDPRGPSVDDQQQYAHQQMHT